MTEDLALCEVVFEVQEQEYRLKRVAGRWQLRTEDGAGGHGLDSWVVTSENYRQVAIEVYQIIHGQVGTFGDMYPYVHLLGLISGEVK